MLRVVFLLLLLGNVGYYLWSHEHLASWGLAPVAQSEPQRLQEQIKPEALILPQPEQPLHPETTTPQAQPAASAPADQADGPEVADTTDASEASVAETAEASASAPASGAESSLEAAATPEAAADVKSVAASNEVRQEAKKLIKEPESCYQATGIEQKQADTIRRALAGLPKGDWELVPTRQSGRWMVYMGKFPDLEYLERKRGELRQLKVEFDRAGGNWEPGLSLGRFSSEEAAQRQLAAFARQGVRTARVVQERAEVNTYVLRLPKATPSFRKEVAALAGNNLLPRALQTCSR